MFIDGEIQTCPEYSWIFRIRTGIMQLSCTQIQGNGENFYWSESQNRKGGLLGLSGLVDTLLMQFQFLFDSLSLISFKLTFRCTTLYFD